LIPHSEQSPLVNRWDQPRKTRPSTEPLTSRSRHLAGVVCKDPKALLIVLRDTEPRQRSPGKRTNIKKSQSSHTEPCRERWGRFSVAFEVRLISIPFGESSPG
jgi:hypothetical protein